MLKVALAVHRQQRDTQQQPQLDSGRRTEIVGQFETLEKRASVRERREDSTTGVQHKLRDAAEDTYNALERRASLSAERRASLSGPSGAGRRGSISERQRRNSVSFQEGDQPSAGAPVERRGSLSRGSISMERRGSLSRGSISVERRRSTYSRASMSSTRRGSVGSTRRGSFADAMAAAASIASQLGQVRHRRMSRDGFGFSNSRTSFAISQASASEWEAGTTAASQLDQPLSEWLDQLAQEQPLPRAFAPPVKQPPPVIEAMPLMHELVARCQVQSAPAPRAQLAQAHAQQQQSPPQHALGERPSPASPSKAAAKGGGASQSASADSRRREEMFVRRSNGASSHASDADERERRGPSGQALKTAESRERIRQSMRGTKLLGHLNEARLEEALDAMVVCAAESGDVIIKQGDVGHHVYVVESGSYEVRLEQTGDRAVALYGAGGVFGELALLYDTPRAASVVATRAGQLWRLDQETFRTINRDAGDEASGPRSDARFLQLVYWLAPLKEWEREQIWRLLSESTLEDGAVICREGEVADRVYILQSGSVSFYGSSGSASGGASPGEKGCFSSGAPKTELFRMPAPDIFGESALEVGAESTEGCSRRKATCVASGRVTLLTLMVSSLSASLLDSLRTHLRRAFNSKLLRGAKLFGGMLTNYETAWIAESMQFAKFGAAEDVVRQGQKGTTFYIIQSGAVQVLSSDRDGREKVVCPRLARGDYFGEMSLFRWEPCNATVRTTEPTTCLTLSKAALQALLTKETINQIFARHITRRSIELHEAKRLVMDFSELQATQQVLGVGTFGRVVLVRRPNLAAETASASSPPSSSPAAKTGSSSAAVGARGGGTHFALKCMSKRRLIEMQQVEHVMSERHILTTCDHPFLMGLVATFEDAHSLYLLLELVPNGELFTLMRRRHRLLEVEARFYCACVCCALSYLHTRQIAFRDLKPENLLIDASGYLKVCDFGFAKHVPDRTYTLCGTPEYLAPEMILNQGHGVAVDWWSMGILLFEMLVGRVPFERDSRGGKVDVLQLLGKILKDSIVFPPELSISWNAQALVRGLLTRKPHERLGGNVESGMLGARAVTGHPFFEELDWLLLSGREMAPPYMPEAHDVSTSGEHHDSITGGEAEGGDALTDKEHKLFAGWC